MNIINILIKLLSAAYTATETKAHNFISKHKLKGFD